MQETIRSISALFKEICNFLVTLNHMKIRNSNILPSILSPKVRLIIKLVIPPPRPAPPPPHTKKGALKS